MKSRVKLFSMTLSTRVIFLTRVKKILWLTRVREKIWKCLMPPRQSKNDWEVERAHVSWDLNCLKHVAVTIYGDPYWSLMLTYEWEWNFLLTRREIYTKSGVKLPRKWTMLFWFTRGKELKSDRCGLVTLQYILQVEFVAQEWREWLINISQTRPDRTSVCWAIFDAVGLRKTWQYPSSEVGKCSEWGRSIWLDVIV